MRPTLKSCLFPIHWLDEIKNSHEPPVGRNFFLQSLCLKRYMTKRYKKTSSWYSKNVTLYIFIYYSYVQFLCWFIVTWQWWLISIKVLSCLPTQIKQTFISIFWPIFGLSLPCRPTLIRYVPQLRLIKKTQWQTWPQFTMCKFTITIYYDHYNWSYYSFFNRK